MVARHMIERIIIGSVDLHQVTPMEVKDQYYTAHALPQASSFYLWCMYTAIA